MKKLTSLFLALLMITAAFSCSMAEEAVFDPCASLWYWDHSDYTYTYDDGTVTESHTDYSLPNYSYATFEFKTDGTYVQTTETVMGEIYTYDGTWEYVSENQIQCKQIVADEEEITILTYEDGMMVESSSATIEAIEDVRQGYTYNGTIYYSTDPDGELRHAMEEYHIDDNFDLSADESTLKKNLTLYGFLDYTTVLYLGFEYPTLIHMDPYAAEGSWHGSITWLDDATASFSLITNGELIDVTGTCQPYMAEMEDGAPALMMDIVDEATGTGYTVLLYKHEGRELYRLQFLTSNGVPVLFQAVPAEIYN